MTTAASQVSTPLDHVTVRVISSMADLDGFRAWLGQRREGPLFFDTESGGLSPFRDRHRLTQIGDLWTGWVFLPGWFGAANEALTAYRGELGAHNVSYDWRVLSVNQGIQLPWSRLHDTSLAGHICDSLRLAGLKPRATVEVDPRAMAAEELLAAGMAKNRWNWDTVPYSYPPYLAYAGLDPCLAAHLWSRFGPQVMGKWRRSYDLEMATARICTNMMMAGMMIDVPYVRATIAQIEQYMARSVPWLRDSYGIESVESNEQVGSALNRAGVPTLKWTNTGKPAIDKDTLKMYAAEFPHAAQLIQTIAWTRKSGAVSGRYLQKFLDLRDADDVIHYSIHTCQAITSRQSVTDPPMQTYDRDVPVVRGSFIPRPGHVFVTIDADQIEARLTAHATGDRNLIGDFIEADRVGAKFFILSAERIFHEKIAKSDPRYTHTKNSFYGQEYGAGLEKAAATAGVPVEQMRPVYDGIAQRYPGVGKLMQRLISQNRYASRPVVRTLVTGRELGVRRSKLYAGLNTLIQGSAAEVLKTKQIELDAAGLGPFLRLDVHDEILMEVPRELAQEVLHTAEQILTDRANFAVPITWSGDILEERWRKT